MSINREGNEDNTTFFCFSDFIGSPRVIGDDEEGDEADDFDDEFPIKHNKNDEFQAKQPNHSVT